MNQQIKFMTVEEFMNTMKRRGTADSDKIEMNLPSPDTFKRHLDKKHTNYQKQKTQKKSDQSYYNHYYINEGAHRSQLQLHSASNVSGGKSEKIIQNLREFDQDHISTHVLSNQNIKSSQQLKIQPETSSEDFKIQQNIIIEFHKIQRKQRFYSPPQQKRDLDNLEDYFKRSRNYQEMNKLIRKNSCECQKCGGKQNRIQNMKGIIPQFIPRQIIRDSLKIKWKKVSKTLRKLCFFFRLAAGGHTKPKNGILRNNNINRQKTGLMLQSANQSVNSTINTKNNLIQINSPSNENVRQILHSDPYYPPFLNLKTEISQQPPKVIEKPKSQRLINIEKIRAVGKKQLTMTVRTQQQKKSLIQDQKDDNSISSDESLKDLESPSQIRKALNKVDNNFLNELTQTRNIQREKSKKLTTLKRSDSRKKTQSVYNIFGQRQSQQFEPQQERQIQWKTSKDKIQTAYQKFLVQPHPKLVDIVNMRSESTQYHSNNLPKINTLSKSLSQKNANYSPVISPASYVSQIKYDNAFNKKQEYYTDRKKSGGDIMQTDESHNISFVESFRINQENQQQTKNNRKQSDNDSIVDIINTSPRKTIEDSIFSKCSPRNKQTKSLNQLQFKNIFEIYQRNNRSNSNASGKRNNSSPKQKTNDGFSTEKNKGSIFSKNQDTQTFDSKRVNTETVQRTQYLKTYQDNTIQNNANEGKYSQKLKKSKLDKNQLIIFEKKDIKSIQKDINHLRLRSLNICKNKDQLNNRDDTDTMFKRSKLLSNYQSTPQQSDFENSLYYQTSKRSQSKDTSDLLPLIKQSQVCKDDTTSSILKKQQSKLTQISNIRFDL